VLFVNICICFEKKKKCYQTKPVFQFDEKFLVVYSHSTPIHHCLHEPIILLKKIGSPYTLSTISHIIRSRKQM
jgi:hypothetical protein